MSIKTCEEYVVARACKLEEQAETHEREIEELTSNLKQCEFTIKELKDIVNSALERCVGSDDTVYYRGEYVWKSGKLFALIEKYYHKEDSGEQN